MTDPSSEALIEASRDDLLLERVAAIAAQLNLPAPDSWARTYALHVANAAVDDSGNTVASVYEYGAATRDSAEAALPPLPSDPTYVTDEYLRRAIASVRDNPPR